MHLNYENNKIYAFQHLLFYSKSVKNMKKVGKIEKTILLNYSFNLNNELYKDKNIPYNEINAGG